MAIEVPRLANHQDRTLHNFNLVSLLGSAIIPKTALLIGYERQNHVHLIRPFACQPKTKRSLDTMQSFELEEKICPRTQFQ
jgi:hypothetical protein